MYAVILEVLLIDYKMEDSLRCFLASRGICDDVIQEMECQKVICDLKLHVMVH